VPDAVLVGGSAAAHHADHRVSFDDDHVVTDLRQRFVLSLADYYADQRGSGGRRIATQVAKQLTKPLPGDLDRVDLRYYRRLDRRWQSWDAVADVCKRTAMRVLERAAEGGAAGETP